MNDEKEASMFNFILKKNEMKQLEILAALSGNFIHTKTDLDKALEMVPASSFRYIRRINEDLAKNPELAGVSIEQTGNILTYKQPIHIKTVNVIRSLAEYYLSESTAYKLLILLKQSQSVTFTELTLKLNISDSYLHKLLKEINTLFEPAHISLRQRHKQLIWHGPKANILFMKYYVLYFTQIFDVPFPEKISAPPLESKFKFEHLNQLETDRLTNFAYLLKKNQALFASVSIENPTCRTILEIVMEDANLLSQYPEFDDWSLDSQLFLNFFLRSITSNIDTLDSKVALAKKLIERNDPFTQTLTQLVTTIFETFVPYFPTTSDPFYIYLLDAHFEMLYTMLLGTNLKTYFKMKTGPFTDSQASPELAEIRDYFADPKHFEWMPVADYHHLNQHQPFFVSSTYSMIRTLKQPTISILLDFIYQPGFKLLAHYKLISVFSPETIKFVDDPKEADLIVTDYAVSTPPDSHLYIFLDVNSKHAFNNLCESVLKIISHRAH